MMFDHDTMAGRKAASINLDLPPSVLQYHILTPPKLADQVIYKCIILVL